MTQTTEMLSSTFPPSYPSDTTMGLQPQNTEELESIIGRLTRQEKKIDDLHLLSTRTSPEVTKRSWDKTKTALKGVAKWGGISAAAVAFMLGTAAAAGVGAGTMGFCGSAVGGAAGAAVGTGTVSVVEGLSQSVMTHGEEMGKEMFSTAFCEKVNLFSRLREEGYLSELLNKAVASAKNAL